MSAERIVDDQPDGAARSQGFDDQAGQNQTDLVGRPAGTGEEAVVAADVLMPKLIELLFRRSVRTLGR